MPLVHEHVHVYVYVHDIIPAIQVLVFKSLCLRGLDTSRDNLLGFTSTPNGLAVCCGRREDP